MWSFATWRFGGTEATESTSRSRPTLPSPAAASGTRTGTAVKLDSSPGFVWNGNVLFRQEYGFFCSQSPHLTLTSNTCVAHMYAAAAIRYSSEDSVCRNKNFAFQDSDSLHIEEAVGQSARLKKFDCDYNNYGTAIGQAPPGAPFDTVKPREHDSFLAAGAKSIVDY